MSFIEFTNDTLNIDKTDFNTKKIIEAFGTLIEKNGFDHGALACGVFPSPDFGYFELADRFWWSSLCIYSLGSTNCFWGSGVGYAEPWLFNTRHAVELYVKGFLLNAVWLDDLQSNPHLSVYKHEFSNLQTVLGRPHNLLNIYDLYEARIRRVINNWNTNDNQEKPDINLLLLKTDELEMLKELDSSDETSFRFRYPSLKRNNITHSLQEINWIHDSSMLFPKTGLPRLAGYFFDHVKVINNLHKLINELNSIKDYFKAITQYQDVLNEYWNEFLSQINDGTF